MTLEPTIIFEDEALVVLNKPAGWVVNRSENDPENTLQDWLEKYFANDPVWQASLVEDPVFFERTGLAHRLDRDTSGVLIIAKNAEVMHKLLAQFKERKVKKTYQALVHGYLPARAGIINAPIARDKEHRTRFTVDEGGRESSTLFHVAEEYKGFVWEEIRKAWPDEIADKPLQKSLEVYQGFSFISLQPKTGRTHQIRVHLKFMKTPIVGDQRYNTLKRWHLDKRWCPRQFLHASQIEFEHPLTGNVQLVRAPLPPDLVRVLSLLNPKVSAR